MPHSSFKEESFLFVRVESLCRGEVVTCTPELDVVAMANLPDVDVLLGLVLQGNGSAFHRGPTHSLIFAVAMGFLASNAPKLSSKMPKMRFRRCFLVIFSHIMGDLLFTNSRVSLLWPLEVYWAPGFTNWIDIMYSVFTQISQDAEIIMASTMLILLKWFTGKYASWMRTVASETSCRSKRYVLFLTGCLKSHFSQVLKDPQTEIARNPGEVGPTG